MGLDMTILVGGEAGQGVQSLGSLLSRAFARGGMHVFADQDYESRIKGGHNFSRIRVSDRKIAAIAEDVDILVCLDEESIRLHHSEVKRNGVVVFDQGRVKSPSQGSRFLGVPMESLATEKGGGKITANAVALGTALGLLGYDHGITEGVIRDHFGTGEISDNNISACHAGYDFARANFTGRLPQLTPSDITKRMLITGNEAIALGAIAAGCKFMAGYPMTPSTSILEYLAGKAQQCGVAVVQTEDEISAINMIIGASFAGARSLTATSGGGFCLMVEGLSLAGMTETPLVVVLGQRPGPAIGLPARTEQGELLFALSAGHGEFPRAVLAPATIEDAFWLTIKAFNLAEKYQTPVILLTDGHLASSSTTVERFDLSKVTIDRGLLLSREDVAKINDYKRHRITPSGISPRALPLHGNALVVTDSDEHDESGHIIEDAVTRIEMTKKRLRKKDELAKEMASPRRYGPKDAEITLAGWGSSYCALAEAVNLMKADKIDVNLVHFTDLWPFPAGAAEILDKANKLYTVENNAAGQLAWLIRAETGKKATGTINKFDGRPFSPQWIAREIKKEVH